MPKACNLCGLPAFVLSNGSSLALFVGRVMIREYVIDVMIGGDYMDILFKTDDFVFSYRVGGILIHEGKILLQRPKNDNYAIIGGHVAAMETSMETLKREFEEEIHAKIEVDNLLAIGEIYFPWGKRPCHQISLYYNVHLVDDNIPLDGVFRGYDELDNERIDLDFCWVPLEDLKKGTKVYPLELIPYIFEPGKEIVHFVSKQI